MNLILYYIWFFLYFMRLAIETNTTGITLSVRKRNMTVLKRFRLSENEVIKLHSLRSAVAQFVATYVSCETFRPTVTRNVRRRKKKFNKPFATSRPTKLTTKGVYYRKEHWPSHKERRHVIYSHLLKILSRDEENKRVILMRQNITAAKGGNCYIDAFSYFMNHCYYGYFIVGGMMRMKKLLAQACLAEWLNADKVLRVLRGCCKERFMFKLFDDI